MFLLLNLYCIFFSQSQIIIPFEELSYKKNPERIYKDIESFYNDQYKTNIFTIFKIGVPEQNILTFIQTENCIFLINNQSICYNKTEYNYNFKNSKTAKNITNIDGKYFYFKTSLINETIKLCTNEKCTKEKTMENFQLNLFNGLEESKNLCSEMGLTLTKGEESAWIRVIYQLKRENLINGLIYTVKYTSDYNGFIYLGQFPHEYNSTNYFIEQQIGDYIVINNDASYILPNIDFNNIYYIYNNIEKSIKEKYAIFYMEYGLILGTKNYFDQIQSDFFSKYPEICSLYTYFPTGKNFQGIICKAADSFKIEEFPSLYFFIRESNYTFELNYNDLFKKNGDYYYFLVIFDQMIISTWKIGKPFLKKYQMTLDIDSKRIIFYNTLIKPNSNKDSNGGNSNKTTIIILIAIGGFIFICGLVYGAFYIGKMINIHRKKRANELTDDDFEYTEKSDNANKNSNKEKGLFKEEDS